MGPLLRRLIYVAGRLRSRSRFRHRGLRVEVPPGVLNPTLARGSFLFARLAVEEAPPAPARVLDLGCGCGLAGLLLAARGHAVTAVDVEPAAVEATRQNALRNGLPIAALVSDWDRALPEGGRFDYVVTNPPFRRELPPALQRAFHAGPGLEAVADALQAVARRLAPQGRGLLFTSSLSGRDLVLHHVRGAGLEVAESRHVAGLLESYLADVLVAR